MTCFTPIKGTHIRVVKLDACGAPVTGSSSLVIVTKGFVQVQIEPQYEDGTEFFERNADGDACVNQKDAPTLKRLNLTVDLCEVDANMLSFVLGARLLDTAATPVTGTGWALPEGTQSNRFSMEVWQRDAGANACSAGSEQFIYHALPNVGNTKIGTYTIQNGRSTFQFMGETRAASLDWGSDPVAGGGGPWLPTGETVDDDEHWLVNETTTALPTEACGPIAWP